MKGREEMIFQIALGMFVTRFGAKFFCTSRSDDVMTRCYVESPYLRHPSTLNLAIITARIRAVTDEPANLRIA